ncbi:hypothetical protein FKM82_027356 [Ascaphus truei]
MSSCVSSGWINDKIPSHIPHIHAVSLWSLFSSVRSGLITMSDSSYFLQDLFLWQLLIYIFWNEKQLQCLLIALTG